MHSSERKTPIPGGNANSTGHRGPLQSVSLKLNAAYSTYKPKEQEENIFFGLFLLQFVAVIESFLVWPITILDADWMRSEVQHSIVQCFAIFWKKQQHMFN